MAGTRAGEGNVKTDNPTRTEWATAPTHTWDNHLGIDQTTMQAEVQPHSRPADDTGDAEGIRTGGGSGITVQDALKNRAKAPTHTQSKDIDQHTKRRPGHTRARRAIPVARRGYGKAEGTVKPPKTRYGPELRRQHTPEAAN